MKSSTYAVGGSRHKSTSCNTHQRTYISPMKRLHAIAFAVSIPFASAAFAQKIGEVDTAFKLIGPDHKIVVEAFDDPKIAGIT